MEINRDHIDDLIRNIGKSNATFILDQSKIELWTHRVRQSLLNMAKKNMLNIFMTNRLRVQSSLCAIEDCQSVIEGYKNLENFNAAEAGYLKLYGLLQSFVVQHDAFKELYNICGLKEVKFKDYNFIREIRKVRNNTIGHPTTNHENAYYLITQTTLNKYGYTLAEHTLNGETKFHNIKIYDLLVKQEQVILCFMNEFFDLLAETGFESEIFEGEQ